MVAPLDTGCGGAVGEAGGLDLEGGEVGEQEGRGVGN